MISLIAAVFCAVYFTSFARLHMKWKLNYKPFNCAMCLGAWLGLILFFVPPVVPEVMCIMFGAGIMSAILSKIFS